jgi:glycosyltransferase involved in cell wall biosynthesis
MSPSRQIGLFAVAEDARAFSQGVNTYVHILLDQLLRHTAYTRFTLITNPAVAACFADLPDHPRLSQLIVATPDERSKREGRSWQMAQQALRKVWMRTPAIAAPLLAKLYFDPDRAFSDIDLMAFLSYNMTDFWLVGFRPYVVAVHDLRFLHLGPDGEVLSDDGLGKPSIKPTLGLPRPAGRSRVRAYEQVLLKNARHLVAPSSFVARDLLKAFGISRTQISVAMCVPHEEPVDVSQADLDAVRLRYRLPPAYLFFPSWIAPTKNHIRLVEAIHYARRATGHPIPLVLTGHTDDSLWPKVLSRINELGVGDVITHLGYVSEMDKWCLFKLARALVLPTLFESTSLPAWEALQCSCPVIATNVYDIPEELGDAAHYFDPLDVQDIARAIQDVFFSASLRSELATKGAKRLRLLNDSWRRGFTQAWLAALDAR